MAVMSKSASEAGVQASRNTISGDYMTNQVMGFATPKDSVIAVSANQSNISVPAITYRNQRVITTEHLALGYGTLPIRIQQNHIRNESRFIEGKHYFRVTGDELKSFRLSFSESVNKHTSVLILWTERGASRHAKMLETDQAWDFYEELEEHYFRKREPQGVPVIPNFSDPAQAARAWADEFEARQRAEAVTHQQAEYIDQLENLFIDGLTPVQFCKRLNGVNTSKVNAWLKSANWLYDDNPDGKTAHWRVRSYARDKYLTEKTSKIMPNESVSFTSFQPILLRSGAVWLYRKYLQGCLPMKQTWNGEFTHDKALAAGGDHE